MANISSLPPELIAAILGPALSVHPNPSRILRVSSLFHTIGYPILYSHLYFRHIPQIIRFAYRSAPPACPPRTITVNFSGTSSARLAPVTNRENAQALGTMLGFESMFRFLAVVFELCGAQSAEGSGRAAQVELEALELRVNTHARDLNMRYVYEALSLANPKRFMWGGTDDLKHHFSIAIVPTATSHLLQAAATWTQVQEITLANVAFPGLDTEQPLLPLIPSLRRLTLDRAIMVSPEHVAGMACLYTGESNLEEILLVDVYSDSIWGPRVRRTDVEKAAAGMEDVVSRIVRCEGKTERIVGGDRAD
ncbi:hypothetical protein BXZ70DRAFT_1017673 [Cristinia sonorae]|uniref:Uncharacterized protein n=1 Tax=Cristinia sonorae TaxID=1940300 RepID=A0A8K0XQY8_9AGAR|nr:hypothetical protein BXZ70DRAFT_1017673 [Cristinia sonorae]